jgi:hypothetical protein
MTFKTRQDAIKQATNDFPLGSHLVVYYNPASAKTYASNGMSEREKVLMLLAFCASVLFVILALRTSYD